MTDFWLGASAIGTLTLAMVAAGALVANVWQVRTSERQFRESEQRGQDTLEAGQRPYLYPFGQLDVDKHDDGSLSFDFNRNDPGQLVEIRNGGAGIAFNVRGALVQPRPRVETGIAHRPRVRSIVLDDPLPVGVDAAPQSYAGPFVLGWDTAVDTDPSNTLVAPVDAIVRLTLTYQDVFGRTHASQFDYASPGVTGPRWVFHAFLPKVQHDLAALAALRDVEIAASQAAFLEAQAFPRHMQAE
jgi:hypothetical protein